jgi:hypothetical protein
MLLSGGAAASSHVAIVATSVAEEQNHGDLVKALRQADLHHSRQHRPSAGEEDVSSQQQAQAEAAGGEARLEQSILSIHCLQGPG